MGRKIRDLTGKRFGNLVALYHTGDKSDTQGKTWVCKCSCGAVKHVRSGNLTGGNIVSCGDRERHPLNPLNEDQGAACSFDEIADTLGVSRQRARNIYEMAIAKVRDNPELMAELKEYL
jgi:hypothetical protein